MTYKLNLLNCVSLIKFRYLYFKSVSMFYDCGLNIKLNVLVKIFKLTILVMKSVSFKTKFSIEIMFRILVKNILKRIIVNIITVTAYKI